MPPAPRRGRAADRTSSSSWWTRCASRRCSRREPALPSSSSSSSCRTCSSCGATASSSRATTAAGNACSPARATIATGLYPHQVLAAATRTATGPSLQPSFPTYGKLLASLGYQTPYYRQVAPVQSTREPEHHGLLGELRFQGMTDPDPIGTNGEGAEKDGPVIADAAVRWLRRTRSQRGPVLPHGQLRQPARQGVLLGRLGGDALRSAVPQSIAEAVRRRLPLRAARGGSAIAAESADPTELGVVQRPARSRQAERPAAVPLPSRKRYGVARLTTRASPRSRSSPPRSSRTRSGVGISPYDYWKRGLDMYVLVQSMVDEQIGKVVAAIPSRSWPTQ